MEAQVPGRSRLVFGTGLTGDGRGLGTAVSERHLAAFSPHIWINSALHSDVPDRGCQQRPATCARPDCSTFLSVTPHNIRMNQHHPHSFVISMETEANTGHEASEGGAGMDGRPTPQRRRYLSHIVPPRLRKLLLVRFSLRFVFRKDEQGSR